MKNNIKYKKKKALKAIKTINYLLFSLRSIGDMQMGDKDINFDEEIKNFILEGDVLNKLVKLKIFLEEPFENYPRVGDTSFLEQTCKNIKYWHPSTTH
jgi:hypothetical protein